jgi:hypothetical protein
MSANAIGPNVPLNSEERKVVERIATQHRAAGRSISRFTRRLLETPLLFY